MIWRIYWCHCKVNKLTEILYFIDHIFIIWIVSINVNWPMKCFNSKLAVISNLWTQRVHYTNSGMLYVQPRNGINLLWNYPRAPVGLIFSMHTDKEGRDMSRMKSKMLKSFCCRSSYFHILYCAEWFSRSLQAWSYLHEVYLVMYFYDCDLELSNQIFSGTKESSCWLWLTCYIVKVSFHFRL